MFTQIIEAWELNDNTGTTYSTPTQVTRITLDSGKRLYAISCTQDYELCAPKVFTQDEFNNRFSLCRIN